MLPNDAHRTRSSRRPSQATEEAIVNALVAAETMTGIDDHTVIALPHDRLQAVLRQYQRLGGQGG